MIIYVTSCVGYALRDKLDLRDNLITTCTLYAFNNSNVNLVTLGVLNTNINRAFLSFLAQISSRAC